MKKRVSKLVLAAALLTGGLFGVFTPQTAASASFCEDYCWDPACTCVFHCWGYSGSGCICEDFCTAQ